MSSSSFAVTVLYPQMKKETLSKKSNIQFILDKKRMLTIKKQTE